MEKIMLIGLIVSGLSFLFAMGLVITSYWLFEPNKEDLLVANKCLRVSRNFRMISGFTVIGLYILTSTYIDHPIGLILLYVSVFILGFVTVDDILTYEIKDYLYYRRVRLVLLVQLQVIGVGYNIPLLSYIFLI